MKLKLDVAEMAEEFFEDAHLLGIVAPIKDYQFCWQLNQRLRFRFRINNDIEIQMSKKNRNYYFPRIGFLRSIQLPRVCILPWFYRLF